MRKMRLTDLPPAELIPNKDKYSAIMRPSVDRYNRGQKDWIQI